MYAAKTSHAIRQLAKTLQTPPRSFICATIVAHAIVFAGLAMQYDVKVVMLSGNKIADVVILGLVQSH